MKGEQNVKYCLYYNSEDGNIVDFLPADIDSKIKNSIIEAWNQDIQREILKVLSEEEEMTSPTIKKRIGHSASTLHENIKKLEDASLIETTMSYEGNKQKIIRPRVLCVTKNPKSKERFQRFFQGLFTDSDKTKIVLDYMRSSPEKYLTTEEISAKTKIPVDEIEILLSNWESQITRSFSDFMKEKPFEKKTLYKIKKGY
jgi:DNA-binding MarR family transcriptional regulator